MDPSEHMQAGVLLGFFGVVTVLMGAPWVAVYWCARYPWVRRVLAAIPFVGAAVVAIVWPRWEVAWRGMRNGTSLRVAARTE